MHPPGPDAHQTRSIYAATVAVYLVVLAYTLLRWETIPDPVPMHIGFDGEVDNWVPKTFLGVTSVLWIGVAISLCIALIVPGPALARATSATGPTDATDPTDATNTAIPFSETAAQRAEMLIMQTRRFIAEVLLFTALLLTLVQLLLVFPDVRVPYWVFIVAFVAYLAWAIWRQVKFNRRAKQDRERLQPDAQELQRIDALTRKAGAGFYSEPNDPMAVVVLPSEPGKLQLNSAHPAGKRQFTRIAVGAVAIMAVPIFIAIVV